MIKVYRFISFFGFFILLFLPILAYGQLSKKDSLLEIYSDTEKFSGFDKIQKIDLLNNIANEYRFREPDSLLLFATKSLDLNKDSTYLYGYARAIIHTGDFHSDLGKNKVAFKYYQRVRNLIKEISDPQAQVALLKSVALHDVFIRDYKKMLENTYKAIEICETNDFKLQEALLRHNLGWLYTMNSLHQEALNEYVIADSIWNIIGDVEHKAGTQSNIAFNAIKTGDFDLVLKNAHESRDYFERTHDNLWHSRSTRVLSRYYHTIEEPEIALTWIKKSDSLISLVENPRDELEVFEWYSKIYFALDEFDKASEYSKKTKEYAERFKDTTKLLQSLELLKDISLKNGQIENSLGYFNQYENLKKNYRTDNENNNLAFLRAKQEFDREQMLSEARVQNEISRQNFLIGASVVVVSGLLIIIFLIRRNYQNQRNANKDLKELNEVKDKIFTIIGHDLKSPISTLQEFLDLYNDSELSTSEIKKITPRLKNNVDHSAFTLNNLLTWANNQMNGTITKPKAVAIKMHATQVVELYAEKIESKNINVECVTNPDLKVLVDSDHLDLILRNLISNAIKFTPENGNIKFNGKEQGSRVVFRIEDSGVGLSKSQLSSIMKGSSIIPQIGTNNEKGTGIGLQITKDLLALNNGELNFESALNSGTTAIIILPKA
ncbi:sensor histidine kinase [Croceivirga thetidis]|uniref:histidine kinase n=1 Tax=Croceivirga thetidis TaxID=2721623 RepID=A0ABX1GR76_9FLAO|nr:HAMP domain-containing sensor histidine kinase [Croceivirga thetidis]NKI32089.1 hypothetical protein [Croceivirga thetidis]